MEFPDQPDVEGVAHDLPVRRQAICGGGGGLQYYRLRYFAVGQASRPVCRNRKYEPPGHCGDGEGAFAPRHNVDYRTPIAPSVSASTPDKSEQAFFRLNLEKIVV